MALLLLFAQTSVAQVPQMDPTAGWIALIIQGGALTILGYHLLFGLPKMSRDNTDANIRMMEMFQAQMDRERNASDARSTLDRNAFEIRSKMMVDELAKMRESIPIGINDKIGEVVREIHDQSAQIDKQTECMDKISKMPSDPMKLCQAKKELTEAGFDKDTIRRLLSILEKMEAKKQSPR